VTPAAFDYACPRSLDDALFLLRGDPADALLLAGGQSLVPLLAQRTIRPRLVVDINRLPGLDRIEIDGDYVRMGALVRQERARLSPLVRAEIGGLSEALEWVANPVVRERGTVVGNLVANAPGAELPAVALALQALFVVRDRTGERRVAAEDLLGPGRRLAAGCIVTHVLWPRSRAHAGFYEVARRDGHAPVVGAVVSVSREICRVGLCGVFEVGVACPRVARSVFADFPRPPEPERIDALLAADLDEPAGGARFGKRCDDAFSDAAYRREVAPTVIHRAVLAALLAAGQAGGRASSA
jgi:carbon-monoxide dehydrogenase medium subunit